MKHLYYARHGQATVNIEDAIGGNGGLTDLGREQAHAGGKKASAEALAIDLIVSSPKNRTRETSEIFAEELRYPVENIVISGLVAELEFGELTGTSWNTFWGAGNGYARMSDYEGAETIEALQQRAGQAWTYLQELPQDNILVVSHAIFGRALQREIEGRPYTDEFIDGASPPHAEIVRIA